MLYFFYVCISCTWPLSRLQYNSLFVGLEGWDVRDSERKIYKSVNDEDVLSV
jgi:hypothetical protein